MMMRARIEINININIARYMEEALNGMQLTIMIVAMWAVISAYTPPDAPAKNMCGLTIDVPIEPAATPAK